LSALPSGRYLPDEHATEALGVELAQWLADPVNSADKALVYLHGELGAGKTTLVRGILRGLGHTGAVKSPTYTLLEPYDAQALYHFDLYRIADSRELEFIGMDDLLAENVVKVVEWPERGGDRLPRPDVEVYLEVDGKARRARLQAGDPA
jgi:tRNA threonylcarbamoyladenosine biosynthesis protein TsaE